MHARTFFIGLGWLCAAVPLAAAQAPAISTETLRLSDLLDEAERSNPELAAERRRWEAAKARRSGSRTPEKPWITLERMYAPRGGDVISGAEEKSVLVSQELPFPTTLLLRGRLAGTEAERAEAELEGKRQSVRSRVKQAYAAYAFSLHALHIYEENVELLRQFASVAQSKYAAGRAAQADVLKAQVELTGMLNKVLTLELERDTAAAKLNTLLNRPPGAPLGMPEEIEPFRLSLGAERYEEMALEAQPALRAAELELQRRGTALSLARSEFLPDLMLAYRRRDMDDGPKTHDAMVGVSVPVWFWKQRSMAAEARAERDAAEAELESAKNLARYEVRSAWARLDGAGRMVELYRTSVLPQAEQALKVTNAAYQSDRASFLDLLDAVRTWRDYRLEHYEHMAEYESAEADLERIVGVDIRLAEAGK